MIDPPEHLDWNPKKPRELQLRIKGALAALLTRWKGGYPPLSKCGLYINHLDIWYSETWGPADWEYGGVVWNQIDVCTGWTKFHVHFHEQQSV